MVELIGQDIDTLYKAKKTLITPTSKSIAFSEEVVSNLNKGDVVTVTNQHNRVYLVIGGLALLTLIGGVYYVYRQRKKEEEKNKEIDDLKLKNEELTINVGKFESFFKEGYKKRPAKPIRMVSKKEREAYNFLR